MSKYSPMVQNSKGAMYMYRENSADTDSHPVLPRGGASCVAFPVYACVQYVYSSPFLFM